MRSNATVLRNRLIGRARLRHLQLFVRVAELGSVMRAAEAVQLTQPAVTHALADLETLLDCTLFLRHSRGMRLTMAGQALLPLARQVLAAIEHGAEQVAAINNDAAGVVRVAAITAALNGLLAQALPEFSRRHGDILVLLEEVDAQQQAALVAAGDADLALCRGPDVMPEGWEFLPLMQDRFTVVCGPAHPLRRRRGVGISQLREAQWLVVPTSSISRDAFDRLFADGPQPQMRRIVTRAPAMLWALLVKEPLLCLLPASYSRQLVDAGLLAEVAIKQELPLEPIGMLSQPARLGDAAKILAEFLEEFARRSAAN